MDEQQKTPDDHTAMQGMQTLAGRLSWRAQEHRKRAAQFEALGRELPDMSKEAELALWELLQETGR